MNLIIILCITHVVWADSANKMDVYHVRSVKEFKPLDTVPADSYFGFSTTYDRVDKRLVISAPRENMVGEVYACNLADLSCSKLVKNNSELMNPATDTHHYWFGATVRATSKALIACAPRISALIKGYMGMHGHCFRQTKGTNEFKTALKPMPPKFNAPKFENEMETLGWTLDIGPNDYLTVGGPGMYNVIGEAAYARSINPKLTRVDGANVGKPPVSFNFGFGVAVGYFLEMKQLSFAISSTYGEKGIGQVYLYIEDQRNQVPVFQTTLNKIEDGSLAGAMFGAALCAANLNKRPGVQAHDLLVGAPTYVENSKYNDGAVFVYIFSGSKRAPTFLKKIKSPKNEGSYFGSAIITLGDLNGDGFDEVAIGAPYENNGQGAVYLYSGATLSSTSESVTWLQRLAPGDKYRSFGLSLAALHDYDDNGCNELAVGVPFENKVMLYKCLATVTIKSLSVKFPSFQNRAVSKRTVFEFEVCLQIIYQSKPKEIYAELSTDVEITHPNARLTEPNNGIRYTFPTSLHRRPPEYCHPINITLPLNGDYGTEIHYKVTTTLADSPLNKDDFNGSQVIFSDASKLTATGSEWAAECKNTKECIPKLSLTIKSNMKNPYIIGSTDIETLTLEIHNTGEVAYDPSVRITVVGAKVYKSTEYCTKMTDVEHTWECTPNAPVRTEKWIIDGFTLELKGLTSNDTQMYFNTTIINSRKTNNIGETSYNAFTLVSDAEQVYVKGSNSYGDIVNMTQDDLLINGKRLEYTYVITNYGVTNFVDLPCKVKLQKEVFTSYAKMPVSYYIDNSDNSFELKLDKRECERIEETKAELTILCIISGLPKQSNVKVVAYMDISAGSQVYEAVLAHNITLNTSLELILPNTPPLTGRLSTLVTLQSASVALWIIILAGLVGVCLIIILALILYECGLLRRKTKAELEKLKTSVKRQTIRRSMMQQPPTEDRLNILERMEEVDEQAVDVVQQPHP